MAKDAPKNILKNMIGSDQTSSKILKDSDILIFLVFLITPTCMVLMTGPKSISHYPPSTQRLIQAVYGHIFSASVRHMDCSKEILYTLPPENLVK